MIRECNATCTPAIFFKAGEYCRRDDGSDYPNLRPL